MEAMRKEFATLGLSFRRGKDLATCDPTYTKWEQKFFIEMWKSKKALLIGALMKPCWQMSKSFMGSAGAATAKSRKKKWSNTTLDLRISRR